MAFSRVRMTAFVATVLVAAFSVPACAQMNFDGSTYLRSTTLHENMSIYWTIDIDLGTIQLAVHAKGVSGWVGFGVSELGGMEGSDIVYYERESGMLTDSYATADTIPTTDECPGDWTLLSAEEGANYLVFEAVRLLNTGDDHDWALIDDSVEGALPTKVLMAWGDTRRIGYHQMRRATASVVFFGETTPDPDPLATVKADSSVRHFEVAPGNFTIPTYNTTYEKTCLTAEGMAELGIPSTAVHVVGFEATIDPHNSKHYVHHLVLRGFFDDNCGRDGDGWADIFVWAWGMTLGQALPDPAGFLFERNSVSGFKSVALETHYDNPLGISDVMDTSGVKVYYTEMLREHDAGYLELGDPRVMLRDQPLITGHSKYTFECPSRCTGHFIDDEVFVFGHYLHMHEAGQRMETHQYRDGQLVHTSEVEYYTFSQAGAFPTRVVGDTIKRGDSFVTSCYYDNEGGTKKFGSGADEEMCIDFIFYYPAQILSDLGYCGYNDLCGGSMIGSTKLTSDSNFERTFGVEGGGKCNILETEAPIMGSTMSPSPGSTYSPTTMSELATTFAPTGPGSDPIEVDLAVSQAPTKASTMSPTPLFTSSPMAMSELTSSSAPTAGPGVTQMPTQGFTPSPTATSDSANTPAPTVAGSSSTEIKSAAAPRFSNMGLSGSLVATVVLGVIGVAYVLPVV